MILIYSPQISSRLTYIARFLFSYILGIPVSVTSDIEEYRNYELPKLNYSDKNLDDITICPHKLLFERGILTFKPDFATIDGFPVLFHTQSSLSSLPFDPFAAAFFMISRYEEYQPDPTDHHNRALSTQSVAYRNGFLEIPVVDHWAIMLRKLIENYYPDFQFPERKYQFIPTIDVDLAFAYKYRGVLRTTGAILKSILTNDLKDNKRRFQTLFLQQPDPYDTFDLLNDWHAQCHLDPRFFFLVGHYGRFDKNLPPFHHSIRDLIKRISNNYKVGIHPSYHSNYSEHSLKHEIDILHKITGRIITQSRQHYLILKFPDTHQKLIQLGIKEDYTMGYAHHPGFRAGTCTPFPFYDLAQETETSLMIYPFQVMDGTLNQYLKLSPLEAVEYITRLNGEVRKVNGTFISLWHNESLGEIHQWKNWREVYEALIKIASA
ncbi:MAG TPA: polysaccharide deacetylase family protein [Bacteroidales bacterium]